MSLSHTVEAMHYYLSSNGPPFFLLTKSYFFCFFFIVLLFICAYKAWVISPPCPHSLPYHPLRPLSLPPPPQDPAETILPLSLILLKRESISNNRKEQVFLLVEIRIAIQGVDTH
jgi:hypothetical protein